MLYNVVTNDWGETTYVPTVLGNVLLCVVLISLLIMAMFFAKKKNKHNNKKLSVKQLAICSMIIALATVFSNVKIIHLPTGGAVTLLSMLVICLPGYMFGIGTGIMTGIAYGVLQLLIDLYILYPMQVVVDYFLAFGALGLSGIFCNSKNGLIKGYIIGILGRYVFAVLSGCLFFSAYAWEGWNPLLYSLVYNGIYIFTEAVITIIIICIPPVKNAMIHAKKIATE